MQYLTIELRQPGNGYNGADLFEDAITDQNLVFYADSLTDIGFAHLTDITKGVDRAIEICANHGLPVKDHFKAVYISDASTHTIRKAWKLSCRSASRTGRESNVTGPLAGLRNH